MTDRFYPLGKHSAEDVWKSSYEIQNEMRSFQRSAYPPGYAGHEPGSRDKFGFSTPGPDAARLTKSSLALREDVDIAEPRRNLAVPRMQVTDERQTFRDLDVPEMDRTYKSAIVSPMFRSMAKTRSLPSMERKTGTVRLSPIPPIQAKLDDEHFTYFVPKAMNREGKNRLMSSTLSKLHKDPQKKVMLPFAGDGTGFRTQCSATEWWPSASKLHEEPSAYQAQFQKPSFYRMSPLSQGKFNRSASVTFEPSSPEDGFGSIRLGTPTVEERAAAKAEKQLRFKDRTLMLDSDALQKTSPFPDMKGTPAARFGYMQPGAGLIQRPSGEVVQDDQLLSDKMLAKVLKLFNVMDHDGGGWISRDEARRHFRRYSEVSANAMFNEVDADGNDEITLQEFVEFWQQVKNCKKKKTGAYRYREEDLLEEMDELMKGGCWVDYKDNTDKGFPMPNSSFNGDGEAWCNGLNPKVVG